MKREEAGCVGVSATCKTTLGPAIYRGPSPARYRFNFKLKFMSGLLPFCRIELRTFSARHHANPDASMRAPPQGRAFRTAVNVRYSLTDRPRSFDPICASNSENPRIPDEEPRERMKGSNFQLSTLAPPSTLTSPRVAECLIIGDFLIGRVNFSRELVGRSKGL